MSFDIFLQGFSDGDTAAGQPDAALQVLRPFFVSAPDNGYVQLRTVDGTADVYGVGGNSLMVNHAGGDAVWDLLVATAVAADWVIMPVGCPVCVVAKEQIDQLPGELRNDFALVAGGADVLRIISED